MTPQTRSLMLQLMAGDTRLMPFLYALKASHFCDVVLNDLLSRGCMGRALVEFIERKHFGNPVEAAYALTSDARKTIQKLV